MLDICNRRAGEVVPARPPYSAAQSFDESRKDTSGFSFGLLSILGNVVGWARGRAMVLVLRVLVHHRLGVASARRAAMGLVWKLVLLVR